ncbi:MAG: RIO1 family regulatory kinase/ATPase [Promethearchaeota archaeon]
MKQGQLNKDHNQRLGFDKEATEYDEYRRNRQTKQKRKIEEVTIAQAREQLLATQKISKVLTVLGYGKEATVLLVQEAETGEHVCAKVYRFFTSTNRKRLQGTKHMLADDMASLAARTEYWNLVEMSEAQIPVPRPRFLVKNILVMDYITAQTNTLIPAPLLRDVDLTDGHEPEEALYESLDILADLFLKCQFIHGDYSDHNLMITEQGLVTMDVSQSVQYNHKTFIDTPVRIRIDKAVKYLYTDISNLNKHFSRRYKISIDPNEVKEQIVEKLPTKLQNYLEQPMEIMPISLLPIEAHRGKVHERSRNNQTRRMDQFLSDFRKRYNI